MALKKKFRTTNGLDMNYHRIALITIEPNQQITILRHSYTGEEARQYEKDFAAGLIEGEPQFPYVDYEYMHSEYNENMMSMKNAYEWLKKQPGFEDSEDI